MSALLAILIVFCIGAFGKLAIGFVQVAIKVAAPFVGAAFVFYMAMVAFGIV